MDRDNELLPSSTPFAKILDLAEDAIISIDEEQRIVLYNQGAEKIFGYTVDEMLGQSLNTLLPPQHVRAHKTYVKDFAAGAVSSRRMGDRGEVFGRRKDGSDFPAEASISKVEVGGRYFFTAILRDVSERKAAEAVIRASLAEKEVLLKEIHHRVKNNLQVVSSLLGLQSRSIQDITTRKMFQDSQNRVHSMALVHERLYQSNNLSEINFPAYINELASHLFRSYNVSESRVQLNAEIEDVRMSIDVAVPCGLIINELVSNSLKYAFPEGRSGQIRIEMCNTGNHQVKLLVADDGIGLPEGVSLFSAKSLGLRLVRTLAEQLGATVEARSSQGAEIEVIFQPTPGTGKENIAMATKILIVEDERITAEDIHDTLVQLGYTVVGIASTSTEALRQAEQFSPDLALMDIRIKGDTDGIETAKILRQRFDIPVVYLTAHADIETLQRAKDAEPLGYIVKPFQEPGLRATIETLSY